MAVNIQIKRGQSQNLPSYAPSGMPLWCEDTHELYFGTGNNIVKIGAKSEDGSENINNPIVFPKLINGRYTLSPDTINRVAVNQKCEFVLPEINDEDNHFHQIVVQIIIIDIVTINLGTEIFFNKERPDLSNLGYYNLIYEHNGSSWVIGCIEIGGCLT